MQAAQRKPETRRPYVDPRKPGKSRLPLSVPQARITDLTSTIEELTAVSSRLSTEIKNVEAEIAKNQEALDKVGPRERLSNAHTLRKAPAAYRQTTCGRKCFGLYVTLTLAAVRSVAAGTQDSRSPSAPRLA